MATGIYSWSQTASSNATADSTINFAEGQAPSSLNDSCRAVMAIIARWRDDMSGVQPSNVVQTTGGTANVQTLTTNASIAALTNGWTVKFKAGASNTSSCTLNVDATGAVAVQAISGTALAGGEIVSGRVYTATYHQPANAWVLHTAANVAFMDSGTLMLFQQTAAPTGWTKQVTHNDKTLRVVSGAASSGGSTAFSTIFAARTITQANLPNVNFTGSASLDVKYTQFATGAGGGANTFAVDVTSLGSHTGAGAATGSISVASGGSGTTMDFAVQYVDLIIASKN